MSTHTPGRLLAGVCIYEDGSKHFCAVQEGSEKKVVALTGLAGEANEQEAMSNSSRLAACWNACEGIPSEELEPGEYGQHIIDTGLEIGKLTAQRDELLEALREVAAWDKIGAFPRVHAAIAKAEGGA